MYVQRYIRKSISAHKSWQLHRVEMDFTRFTLDLHNKKY